MENDPYDDHFSLGEPCPSGYVIRLGCIFFIVEIAEADGFVAVPDLCPESSSSAAAITELEREKSVVWFRNEVRLSGKLHPVKRLLTSAFLLLLVATVGGCVASGTLPPRLSDAESHRWANTRLSYTVGVEPCQWPDYSNALLAAIQSTNLFTSVKPVGQCTTPPKLIARVEEQYYGGDATIPIWTILSLGIVPTVVHESFGYDFSLRFSDDERHRHHVRYVCDSTTTLGWISLPEALSPNVTLGDIRKSERFRGRLALAILKALPSVER